ncbi:MAG: hypothetical protein HY894_02080 [Deltaproteobacteria bacterium]|nr:hypothetical protein [Deltaproteobacteria bacterium]
MIAGGYGHSVLLNADGTVWAWGYNYEGQLGDGTFTSRLAPAQVALYTTNTDSASLTLTIAATDNVGVAQMRFSNDHAAWSAWQAYSTMKAWTLTSANGTKTVYAQFRDGAGNVSAVVSDSIEVIKPDLAVSSVSGPASAVTGVSIAVSSAVANMTAAPSPSGLFCRSIRNDEARRAYFVSSF